MINISTNNPQSNIEIKNKNVSGLTLNVAVTTGTGAPSGSPIDADKLQLTATLIRGGVPKQLFNTTLKNLVTLDYLANPIWNFLKTAYLTLGTTSYLIPLRVDFGGALNLKGDDILRIDWQLNSGFAVAASDVTNAVIAMDEVETTETEYFTPIKEVIVIQANQENPSFSLGENVMKIVFRQDDKTSIASANAVINSINLQTKQGLTKQDTYNEILTKNQSYYPNTTEFGYRVQNFILYAGADELDGVQLGFNLNPGNVNSSKNFILVQRFETSDEQVTRGMAIEAKKDAESEKKGSYNSAYLGSIQI